MDTAVSHVRVASNVYLLPGSVLDEPFRLHVRGRAAIRWLLNRRWGGGRPEALLRYGRGWLSDRQLRQLDSDTRCTRCHRVPEGLDRSGQIREVCWTAGCALASENG